jgi:hypothetical protein
MLDSEWATDIGLVVGVILFVMCCCVGTLVGSWYNHRRFRPREDSGESLV